MERQKSTMGIFFDVMKYQTIPILVSLESLFGPIDSEDSLKSFCMRESPSSISLTDKGNYIRFLLLTTIENALKIWLQFKI